MFIKLFVGLFIGAFFCTWLYHHIDIEELIELSAKIKPIWIAIGVGFYALAFTVRVFRWSQILKSFAAPKISHVFQTLAVGQAMNIILPARIGELFRMNLCKNWYNIPRSLALSSIFLERLLDGIIVVLSLLVGASFLSAKHPEIQQLIITGSSLFGLLLLIFFLLKKFSFKRIENFQKGLQSVSRKTFFQVIALSGILWIFEGLLLWSVVRATGVSLAASHLFLLVGMVALSTLIPSPPGFLGTLQFAFALCLKTLGIATVFGVLAASLYQIFFMGTFACFGMILYTWKTFKINAANQPWKKSTLLDKVPAKPDL